MCGIGGIIGLSNSHRPDPHVILRMKSAIKHRGPDGECAVEAGQHRSFFNVRLAIIDIEGGSQPFYNEDGSIGIVYNGEIYNYKEIRSSLIKNGHKFKTHSDGEVIVHLFEESGTESFSRLEGMFAFALWTNDATYLVRDRVGMKPLYYYCDNDSVIFCSEIRGIKCISAPFDLDKNAVRDYLIFRYIRHPDTIFRQVKKLPQGSYMKISRAGIRITRYWDLAPDETYSCISNGEAAGKFRELMEKSIKSQLVSDVPVGVLLSGGTDSSTISYFLNKLGANLHAFTIGFKEQNEFDSSREIAQAYGLSYHEYMLDSSGYLDYLLKYIDAIDEPIADAACIPLFKLAEEIRRHVKVVLSGEGGDELLAGYGSYANVINLYTEPNKRSFEGFWELNDYFPENNGLLIEDKRYEDRHYHYFKNAGSLLNGMLRYDYKTWLADNLMMKADKMLMANSIEGRFPYLDTEVTSFLYSLPERMKLYRGVERKWLLKKAMAPYTPKGFLFKPKKGFASPYPAFLESASDLVRDVISKHSPLNDIIDHIKVLRLFNDYLSGANTEHLKIWTIFVLYLWVERNLSL